MVAIIIVLCAVEAVIVHLALSRVSVALAIAVILLTAYAVLWIAGDARATVLSPVLVGKGVVKIRWGVHFNEKIPIELISSSGAGETPVAKSERVNLVPLGGDPFWIEFAEPVAVRAFTGRKRAVKALAVSPDDRCGLKRALELRVR